jgi:hypothetical protein
VQIAGARAVGVRRRSHWLRDMVSDFDFLGRFCKIDGLQYRSSTSFRQ